MTKRNLPFLAALALLASCSSTALADQVLSVGDGDTITVTNSSGKTRIRLACIDAPETSQKPAGPAARAALQQLLLVGSTVQIRQHAIDKYGRTVAEVFSNGRNINQAMVSSGAAFVYWQYIKGCDRNAYARLEQQAKARRLGVWSDPGLLPPWDYRRCRKARSC